MDAVSYTDPVGTVVTVQLDGASGQPVSASPGEGANSSFEYGEYKRDGTLQVPQRLTNRNPGGVEELRIAALDLRTALSSGDFELPPGYNNPPALGEPRAVKVAEGVFRVDGMPANYHTVFVVDGSEVSVFGAPQSPEWSAITLKLIRETASAARVTRVLITHHHVDHSGGLAPYVAEGATVVCGAGVDEFLRGRLPEAQRAAARFEVVTSSRTFGSGTNRIEAHPVPNEHADGSVAYYLPGSRVLLQGDLFYVPERGPVPAAFSVTSDLAHVPAARQLGVATIIGVHGRQGTMAKLRESLVRRSGLHAGGGR